MCVLVCFLEIFPNSTMTLKVLVAKKRTKIQIWPVFLSVWILQNTISDAPLDTFSPWLSKSCKIQLVQCVISNHALFLVKESNSKKVSCSSPTPFVAQHQLRAASASEQIALPQRAGVCSVASMAWASASEPYCPAYLTRPNYIYPFVNCKPFLFTVD